MKTNNLLDIIKMGNISISKLLLKNYKQLGLSSEEFIFLSYLMNEGDNIIFDIEKMAIDMGLETIDILHLVDSLKEKDMINVIVSKKDKQILSEFISLDSFYNKISNILLEHINSNRDTKDNSHIFEAFEKEFGRTLSPMEYEIINAWNEANINQDLILEALREATFNGVSNLRYIDKIIYEWNKKGLKNVDDIKKHNMNRTTKKEKVEVFSYNWLEEDENEK